MTLALIPAGGQSIRMGRPKLALPVAGRTVLEHVLTALRQAGVERTLVILGPQAAELAPLACAAGAHAAVLVGQTPDMRATVEKGLDWLEERFHPAPTDDWLLVPADHPTLHPGIISALLAARRTGAEGSILIPTYQGRRGHPALIPWRHVPALRALPPEQGLNAYMRRPGVAVELPLDFPEVLADLDTPEDYERLLRALTV